MLPPSIEPTATGHIQEQIEIIEKIIENGFAYVVNGSVYFDVKAYSEKFETLVSLLIIVPDGPVVLVHDDAGAAPVQVNVDY